METTQTSKKWNKSAKAIKRRKSALARLKKQLQSKLRPLTNEEIANLTKEELAKFKNGSHSVLLTDKEIRRINEEIKTLEGRI